MSAEIDTPLQQDIAAALREALAEHAGAAVNITAQQLRALSCALARRLSRRIGGRYVAFVEDRAQRDAAVLAAFDGRNREAVIRKFGISRRLFYSILSRAQRLQNSAEI